MAKQGAADMASWLRQLRESAGLTQTALARVAGCRHATVCDAESGRRLQVSPSVLRAWLSACGAPEGSYDRAMARGWVAVNLNNRAA